MAHALIIAISRINKDPKYESYCKGYRIRPEVQKLLATTGNNLDRGGGIAELVRFQEHFHEYKIVVYQGQSCDSIMFEGRVQSPKRINLLYDDGGHYYHVITNIRGAMARRYVCKACTPVTRRAATVRPSLRASSQVSKSRARRAIGISEVTRVSIDIRQTSCEERRYAKGRETASRAVVRSWGKTTNVLNRTARPVSGTWRSGTSATCPR